MLWLFPCTISFMNESNSMEGSLFIVHDCLRVKRLKIGFFHRKWLEKKKQHFLAMSIHWAHGVVHRGAWGNSQDFSMSRVHGRMRQPLIYDCSSFGPFFACSYVLWCLGTWNEFSLLYIIFKYVIRSLNFNLHIFDPSHDVLISSTSLMTGHLTLFLTCFSVIFSRFDKQNKGILDQSLMI